MNSNMNGDNRYTRRRLLKSTGVSTGVLASITQTSSASSSPNTIHVVEATLQYDLDDPDDEDYYYERSTVCEAKDYLIDPDRESVKIRNTQNQSAVRNLLSNSEFVLNFGGLSPLVSTNIGGQFTKGVVSNLGQGIDPIRKLVLDSATEVPDIRINRNRGNVMFEHQSGSLTLQSRNSGTTELPNQSLEVQTLTVLDEKVPLEDGMEEWQRSNKTENRVETVNIRPKLHAIHWGELKIE